MANEIRADYQQLAQVAEKFEQQSELLVEMQRQVEKALHPLQNGSWQGKGSTAFFGEMDGTVSPAVRRLQTALQRAQRDTNEMIRIIQAAEEDAANPFKPDKQSSTVVQAAVTENLNGDGAWEKFSGWVHGALDVAGFVPGLGIAADGINAVIHLAEGHYVEAAVSVVAMVPVFGDAAKGGKLAARAGKEVLEEGAERVAKEGAESAVERIFKEQISEGTARATKAGLEPAFKTIRNYVEDGHALEKARELGNIADHSGVDAAKLFEDLASRSVRGSGDRVVLGRWKGIGNGNVPDLSDAEGYITEAVKNGGKYYHPANGVYDAVRSINKDAGWQLNERFLHRMAEERVERFDFVGKVDEVLTNPSVDLTRTSRYKELKWLENNARNYGYVREGNSWVLKK